MSHFRTTALVLCAYAIILCVFAFNLHALILVLVQSYLKSMYRYVLVATIL